MLDKVKKRLVGLTITDVGMVNLGGVRHALVRLSDSRAVYIPWENVVNTGEPARSVLPDRRPVAKAVESALTMVPNGLRIKGMK